jgi:hypothetical protein
MTAPIVADEVARWQRFVEADKAATAARMELFAHRAGLLELLRRGLDLPGERPAALDVASRLTTEELQALFPDLLALASFRHGLTARCREVILRLPSSWLLANIEAHATPLLANGGEEEYRTLLPLYARIDTALALRLARAAAQNADEEVREAGEDYLHAAEQAAPGEREQASKRNGQDG